MNWINLRTESLRSPDFLAAKPGTLETWLRVLAYCCEQENGGFIAGAAEWVDRQWLGACGVTRAEVENAAPLLRQTPGGISVAEYPREKENEVQIKRAAGKLGGSAKTKAKTQASRANGANGGRPAGESHRDNEDVTQAEPKVETQAEPKLKPNGMVMEGERNENRNGIEVPPTGVKGAAGKRPDALPTSPEAIAISELFGRRLTTAWNAKEIATYRDGVKRGVITADAITRIATYYAAERARGANGNHRRDLSTFLNNFDGELDRANSFAACPPEKATRNGNAPDPSLHTKESKYGW